MPFLIVCLPTIVYIITTIKSPVHDEPSLRVERLSFFLLPAFFLKDVRLSCWFRTTRLLAYASFTVSSLKLVFSKLNRMFSTSDCFCSIFLKL